MHSVRCTLTRACDAGDIILFNDVAVVFKRMGDIIAIVTGSQDENEIILHTVLQAFCEALNILLRFAPLNRHAADSRSDKA
jgi:coatomer subunit zeta